MRHLCWSPAAHSPTTNLEVLLNSLLIEALGQGHHSPLQLETQGHLGGSAPVLLSNGLEHWILQENRGVLVHPGREAEVPCA